MFAAHKKGRCRSLVRGHCQAGRPTCSERFDRPERLTVEGLVEPKESANGG